MKKTVKKYAMGGSKPKIKSGRKTTKRRTSTPPVAPSAGPSQPSPMGPMGPGAGPMMKKGGIVTKKKMKKFEKGGETGPGPKTTFQSDSLNFRKNERAYSKKPSVDLENKMLSTLDKYGPKKLTGKSEYLLNDMIIPEKKQQKTGGTVTYKKGGIIGKSKKKK